MGGEHVFGLTDFWIVLALALCILSVIACVVYGVLNWNKGAEKENAPEEVKWEKNEEEIEEKL